MVWDDKSRTGLVGVLPRQGHTGETIFPTPFLWSLTHIHTHSPQGPEIPSAVGKGSQKHRSSMKPLWEQGQGKGVLLYCPFLKQPKHSSCAGLPSHSTPPPSKATALVSLWRSCNIISMGPERALQLRWGPEIDLCSWMEVITPACTSLMPSGCRINKIQTPALTGVVSACSHLLTLERDQACLSCRFCLVQQGSCSLQMRSRSQLYLFSLLKLHSSPTQSQFDSNVQLNSVPSENTLVNQAQKHGLPKVCFRSSKLKRMAVVRQSAKGITIKNSPPGSRVGNR